jgi:hypothetical protein
VGDKMIQDIIRDERRKIGVGDSDTIQIHMYGDRFTYKDQYGIEREYRKVE